MYYYIPVSPPRPAEIKAMRLEHGLTQPQAAAISGVALQTWKGYEADESNSNHRRPNSAVWGAFLLGIGVHPKGIYTPREKTFP